MYLSNRNFDPSSKPRALNQFSCPRRKDFDTSDLNAPSGENGSVCVCVGGGGGRGRATCLSIL